MKKKMYDGKEHDIVISIPSNTVEMKVCITMYEDGALIKAEQTLDLESIKECEKLFWQTAMGEYPEFTLTDYGKELLGEINGAQ